MKAMTRGRHPAATQSLAPTTLVIAILLSPRVQRAGRSIHGFETWSERGEFQRGSRVASRSSEFLHRRLLKDTCSIGLAHPLDRPVGTSSYEDVGIGLLLVQRHRALHVKCEEPHEALRASLCTPRRSLA